LDDIRRQIGSLAFSAQYLQRPVPIEGNLIRRSWIQWYDSPAILGAGQVVQSWDVASTTGNQSNFSVCTTWRKHKKNRYLLHVWRGRLEFPKLKHKLIALAREYSPARILIERAGPGLHLIQEFKANPVAGVPTPIGVKVEGDKLVRMEAQSARFEEGQVYLPREAPWLSEFLHEILSFPNSRHDDQVDSVSQFLKWAATSEVMWAYDGLTCVKVFQAGREITSTDRS
jgi:predicted phage terminase large subunit-like protein